MAGAFLVAGLVKGVVGLGMPTVSLALMAAVVDLKVAIVLVLVPAFATNVWQSLRGGRLGPIVARHWPLLALACLGIWFGAGLLAQGDGRLYSGGLGLLLMAYAGFSLGVRQVPPPGRHEVWLGPLTGALSVLSSGMTGSFAVPGVPYFQALALKRDELIQTLGITFTVATVALALALGRNDMIEPAALGISAAALMPAFAGVALGQAARRRLSENRFRQVFFAALGLLGLYLAVKGLGPSLI